MPGHFLISGGLVWQSTLDHLERKEKKKKKKTPATAAPARQLVCRLPGPGRDTASTPYSKRHGRDFRVEFVPSQSLKL